MKSEKVSIVIPVYNVEVYLKKCMESVLNQTYSYPFGILLFVFPLPKGEFKCIMKTKIHKLGLCRRASLEFRQGAGFPGNT